MELDRPIVLATRNEGKVSELRRVLDDFPVEIKSLQDFGPIPPVREDGETFEDNAVKKARQTARIIGLPAIADDSGLEVFALNGKPGVRSARFAGRGAGDQANNLKLLEAMRKVRDRRARFVCVLAIAVPRGPALVYEGTCEGEISDRMIGGNGFGYDPLFYYAPLRKTFAQLTGDEKNAISHRGKALEKFHAEFSDVLAWLMNRFSEERFG